MIQIKNAFNENMVIIQFTSKYSSMDYHQSINNYDLSKWSYFLLQHSCFLTHNNMD